MLDTQLIAQIGLLMFQHLTHLISSDDLLGDRQDEERLKKLSDDYMEEVSIDQGDIDWIMRQHTLPTSLCTQRLRDTKIQYDCVIFASNLAVSNPYLKDVPLLTWKQYRDEYLDACLTLDGRGRHYKCSTCAICQKSNPTFRCHDCFGLSLYCKACILNHHRNEPLHFLEVLLPWPSYYSNIVSN